MIKRLVAVAAFLAVCLSTAAAADKTDPLYPRHDVSLGLSPITAAALLIKISADSFNQMFVEQDLATEDIQELISDFHSTGGIVVGYSYRLSKRLAIGGTGKFEAGSMVINNAETGEKTKIKINFSGVYCDVKYHWAIKKYFWLYSRADIGIKYDYLESSMHAFKFAWQVVPVAIEVGKNQMRFYIEIGGGNQGFGTFGIRYRF